MTHRIGWEMENQARKTGRNQGLAAGTVWLRGQTLQTSYSSPLLCVARAALLHRLHIATGKTWLTLPARITQ